MADMERKLQHIEQFAPILVQGLCRILGAKKERETKAMDGLAKILGRDSRIAEAELDDAHKKASSVTQNLEENLGGSLEHIQKEQKKKIRKRNKDEDEDEEDQLDLDL